MSGMTEANPAERNPQAIICLDSSVKLWRRLERFFNGQDCPSDLTLTRSPKASADLLVLCRRLVPALLVIEDTRLQRVPFKELRDLIAQREVQVLVFSSKIDDSSYEYFFRQGCAGVLPAEVADQTLGKAIQAIFAGELWMPRKVLSRLARDTFPKGSARKLTRRESDIFKLISQGLTNQQIADQLFISRETVRWHVRSLYSKIGVDNRMGAIRDARHLRDASDPGSDSPDSD